MLCYWKDTPILETCGGLENCHDPLIAEGIMAPAKNCMEDMVFQSNSGSVSQCKQCP